MSRADAIAAAERGFAIFPIEPGMKEASLDGWPDKACADPRLVERYWPSDRHNLGVVAGKSNLVILDLDAHGAIPEEFQLPGINDGKDIMVHICDAAGMDWPYTYTVQTPSGGWHLYFRAPEGHSIRNWNGVIAPQVDIKVNNGYVVGAGSVTPKGTYEVLYDEPVIELPRWILRLLTPPEPEDKGRRSATFESTERSGPGRLQGLVRSVENAQEGTRNSTLFWAACTVLEFSPQDMNHVADAARRAGLDNREVARTIHSARVRVGAL